MKRSTALKRLYKLLKTWEGSKITPATAKAVLDLLESDKIGMMPP